MIMSRDRAARRKAETQGHPVVQEPPPTQAQIDYLTWMMLHDLVRHLNTLETRREMSRVLAEVQRVFVQENGFLEMTQMERKDDLASLLNELVEEHLGLVFTDAEDAF